jgi:anti-anti-sigma factor
VSTVSQTLGTAPTTGGAADAAGFSHAETGSVAIVTLGTDFARAPFALVDRAGGEIRNRLVERGSRDLLVDLTSLEHIDSSVVALVVQIWKVVRERNGRTIVAVAHGTVREVLEIARLTQFWTLVATREQGLELLGVGDPRLGGAVADGADDSRTRRWLTAVAILGATGAIGGALAVAFASTSVPASVGWGIALVSGVAGLVAGTLLVRRVRTGRRIAGAAVVLLWAGGVVASLVRNSGG